MIQCSLLIVTTYVVLGLWHVMQLCEKLLLEHSDKLSGPLTPLHRAIIFCLISSDSSLRQRCYLVVHRLVSSLAGTQIASQLLTEFNKYLESTKFQVQCVILLFKAVPMLNPFIFRKSLSLLFFLYVHFLF